MPGSINMVCLLQSPWRITPVVENHVPVLLTNTLLYSHEASRLVLPEELLLIQGIPVPGLEAQLGIGISGLYPFAGALHDLFQDRAICKLAGNGMHISQVGAALLLALCCARESL